METADFYPRYPNAFRGRLRIKTSVPSKRLQSYKNYPNVPLTFSTLNMINPGTINPTARTNVYGYGKRQYGHQTKEAFEKYRHMFEPRPQIKQAALPSRAPMSMSTKIPGRLFQKCQPVPEDITKPSWRLGTPSTKVPARALSPKDIPLDTIPAREAVSSKLPQRPIRTATPEARANTSLYDFSTLESEIYAISFKDNGKIYDPESELHSDYYSIRRLPVRYKKTVARKVTTSTDPHLLLTGCRKEIHDRSDYISSPEPTTT